ncbi:CidA/LrgA family protein [Virgibacillus halodenitrificans]|uniref:CidA/LrgA family protein n=1 Tax=Virgibacillus halodenitrificans TaxID=1482 RepID=A0AAC9J3L4_VIRHA|nr:CidA/LrgA family protein [Virgibacillus halodenitrificans]APC49917.1 CidA/LrgA family protein [Virgibacillus halodenitrificans]MYL58773.1 CidA/LrgA family holin-like protein [Virgibacillus halodenitrificans]WHX25832.1 CidA/LrgA family protein [Virgibacillus halodenitrificans]
MFKVIQIIIQIGLLSLFYLVGDWMQSVFNLVVPGSVIGMLLLFLFLSTGILKTSWIETGTKLIINNLAFFFIPVTVGVLEYYDIFAGKGILLVAITLGSTILVMTCGGLISQWLVVRGELKNE